MTLWTSSQLCETDLFLHLQGRSYPIRQSSVLVNQVHKSTCLVVLRQYILMLSGHAESFDSDKNGVFARASRLRLVRKPSSRSLLLVDMWTHIPEFLYEMLAAFSTRGRDDSEYSKYSLKPADFPAMPLYAYYPEDPVQHTFLLNDLEVFSSWYVFKMWQSQASWKRVWLYEHDIRCQSGQDRAHGNLAVPA